VRVGVISGSGSYTWPDLEDPGSRTVATDYGDVELTEGTVGGHTIVHLCRHGAGHARLSNHVEHHANLEALGRSDIAAVVSLTVCGAVDPAVEPAR
jgi:5'-methylthioadenosine phosphorylase